MNRYIDNKHNCTYAGGQFIILSSIFAAILSQEIESLEDLELLAAFLIAVAEEGNKRTSKKVKKKVIKRVVKHNNLHEKR